MFLGNCNFKDKNFTPKIFGARIAFVVPDRLVAGLKILALPTVVRIHLREYIIRECVYGKNF